MKRRQLHPESKVSASSEEVSMELFCEYGEFVVHLNLMKIRDTIRQRANATVIPVVRKAQKVCLQFLAKLLGALWHCFEEAIEKIVTGLIMIAIVVLAFLPISNFLLTPLAHQIGISITAEDLLTWVIRLLDIAS